MDGNCRCCVRVVTDRHLLQPSPQMLGITYRRAVLFGTGIHRWPDARASTGLWAVSKFANKNNFRWTSMPSIHADVALNDKLPHIIVARPTTIVNTRVAEVLSRVVERYEVPYEDLYIVHHDPDLQVGTWKFEEEVPQDYKPPSTILAGVVDLARMERVKRFVIGVGRPPGEATSILGLHEQEWLEKADEIAEFGKMVPQEKFLYLKAVEEMMKLWETTAFEDQRIAFNKWVENEKYEQRLRKDTEAREKIEKAESEMKLQRQLSAQAQEEERLRAEVTKKLREQIERSRKKQQTSSTTTASRPASSA